VNVGWSGTASEAGLAARNTALCCGVLPFSTLVHAGSARDYLNAPIDAWLISDNAGYAMSTVVPRVDPD
jgi:hypothetical protein